MIMKSTACWVLILCGPEEDPHFRWTYCQPPGQRNSQQETGLRQAASTLCWLAALCWILAWFTLHPWSWRQNLGWHSSDYMVLYPEDRTLLNHHCENLKSYTYNLWFYTKATILHGHTHQCTELVSYIYIYIYISYVMVLMIHWWL